jgi:hypothetical protein
MGQHPGNNDHRPDPYPEQIMLMRQDVSFQILYLLSIFGKNNTCEKKCYNWA